MAVWMRSRMLVFFSALLCLLPVLQAQAKSDAPVPGAALVWKTLEPGLDLARFSFMFPLSGPQEERVSADSHGAVESGDVGDSAESGASRGEVTILRIAPEKFTFVLHMASEKGDVPLAALGKTEQFAAAINAGMFLPDKATNTGYLRNATHTNNARIAANLGAFFIAEPKRGSTRRNKLPRALLLDREDDWQKLLPQYGIVMQNFRMNTPEGEVIWKRRERLHSITALSQDSQGRVYFILCRNMVQGADFASALLALPLRLRTVMYLEGGSESALLINAGDMDTIERGRSIWSSAADFTLPNVLGIRRK